MKKSWRRVVKHLSRPGAFLTRDKFGCTWRAYAPQPGRTHRLESITVRDSTVEEMRRAGIVIWRTFGNTQMLGLPEAASERPEC